MRYTIIILAIIVSFSCTKKKEPIPELIKYDSEIFSGNDSLIYGNWTYLFTRSLWFHDEWDTVTGIDVPDLVIQPIGNYTLSLKNQITESGKIDTLYFSKKIDSINYINRLAIRFCKNGIKIPTWDPPPFRFFEFLGSDTLYMYLVGIKEIKQNYYLRTLL
jgi:hypothetical protein